MKRKIITFLGIILITTTLCGAVPLKPKTPSEWRTYLNFRKEEALRDLYKINPSARAEIAMAKGYAVFTNFNVNLFLASTSNGRGVLHDNRFLGKDTYMRMAQIGFGFGLGIKDFRVIFVFNDESVLEKFLNDGWQFGGEADAAVKGGGAGAAASGAIEIAPGLRAYQLTENGLALQATVKGTKYWKDDFVNETKK